MSVTEAAQPTGPARRRARTHAALLAAARELLVEQRDQASIEEITKRAGVGFGSFFNHFPNGKDELYSEAVLEILDAYADWVRSATSDLEDPAEVFARSFRLTGRLAAARPELFAPLLARGTELLLVERGLHDVALQDLQAGVASGRFVDIAPELHLMAVGGVLLGLLRAATASMPLEAASVDAVAAGVLRLLGVNGVEASEICTRELPELADPNRWSAVHPVGS
jgi:AcrR family transcriptional regulator